MLRSKRMLSSVFAALGIVAMGVSACLASEPAGRASAVRGGRGGDATPAKGPESLDLRPSFQQWGLDTRSQGKRGTCSAFVLAGAMEYALASKQHRAARLSVEFLNWASNRVTKQAEDGGFFSDLWKGYVAYGVCPEKEMPYLDHFDPNLKPSDKALAEAKTIRETGLQLHWIKEWDPKKGLTGKQLAEVKRTLRRGWPVCGGFLWPKQERWENGILQICPRDAVRDGHSVLLVGFRDDEGQPGGGVFLIRSSSGSSRDGLMTYEYVRTYMNDAVWIDCAGATGSGSPEGRRRPQPNGEATAELLFRHPLGALAADAHRA